MRKTSGTRLAVLFAALALFAPVRAWAFDCDTKVADEAGAFGDGDAISVQNAVAALERQGAEVRVRTVRDFGGPGYASLDAYKAAAMRFCPSWQAADNPGEGMKNNLIVFMVSYGSRRGAGLYYGDQWRAKLDAEWPGLLSGQVVPRLRDGRNGEAFVTAMNGVAGLIKPAPARGTSDGPVVVKNEAPTDLTGLWWVLGAVVFIGAVVLLALLLRSRRRDRERRQAAQAKAKDIKARCGAKIAEFDDASVAVLEAEVYGAAEAASDEDAKPLREKFASMKANLNAATGQFAELLNAKNDPSFDDYAIETYVQIEKSFQDVLGKLRKAEADRDALKQGVIELSRLIAEVPAKIEAAKAAIAAADGRRKAVQEKGFKTPGSDTEIGAARKALDEALTAKNGKRFGAAAEAAGTSEKLAGDSAVSAEEMPKRFEARQASVAALRSRIDASRASIKAARPVFAAIQSEYAESCWDTINRNGSNAEAETDEAQTAADDAARCATMEAQDWDGAKTYVDGAAASLERAESLIRSIHALKANLETAKREAPGEIDLAEKDILAARAYIESHDADLKEALETDLDAVEKRLKGARKELGKDKPDYLEVIEAAKAANAAADKILANARTEFEAMEAKRARANSAKRDAAAAISKTREYIEDHASDVGVGARNELASASRQLERAGSVESASAVSKNDDIALAASVAALDAIVKNADGAKETAEAALKAAKADYKRAEDAREEAREQARRRAAAAARARQEAQDRADAAARASRPSFPSFPSTPSIGGSSSGGGGSVSIGRSSSGGGGSVGW